MAKRSRANTGGEVRSRVGVVSYLTRLVRGYGLLVSLFSALLRDDQFTSKGKGAADNVGNGAGQGCEGADRALLTSSLMVGLPEWEVKFPLLTTPPDWARERRTRRPPGGKNVLLDTRATSSLARMPNRPFLSAGYSSRYGLFSI